MSTKSTDLTAERVRELLDYNPVTGALDWSHPTDRSPREGGKAGALARAGSKYQFRRFVQIDYKRYPAHRVIWLHAYGAWPAGYIVPKNGDYDDLRLDNFAELSASDAARRGGPRRTNTSGHRGVTWAKDKNRWLAYITHNYKRTYVGYFQTMEEAVAARDAAAANLDTLPVLDKAERDAKAAAMTRDARLRVMWRKVQRQTYGVTKWTSFDEFAQTIGDLPLAHEKKLLLVPVRPEETIGPDNFQWQTQERAWDYTTREGKRAYAQAHRNNNRNSYRDKSLRTAFGIGMVEYETMLAAQGGVCASCKKPEKDTHYGRLRWLAVDHCHATGVIRGLLCGNCNKGLGHFNDDPALLDAAAAYLRRHAAKSSSTSSPVRNDGASSGPSRPRGRSSLSS